MSSFPSPSIGHSKRVTTHLQRCQLALVVIRSCVMSRHDTCTRVDCILVVADNSIDSQGVITLTSGTGGGSSIIGSISGSGTVVSAGSGANRLLRGYRPGIYYISTASSVRTHCQPG